MPRYSGNSRYYGRTSGSSYDRSRTPTRSSSYAGGSRDRSRTPTRYDSGAGYSSYRSSDRSRLDTGSGLDRRDDYESTTSSRYRDADRSDAYVGSSRDVYPYRERDPYGSLSVDPRRSAIPERRYESYLTARPTDSYGSSSRDRSSSLYSASSYGGYNDLSSVRYGESAGGTSSTRNARDDDLARERRRDLGLPSETSRRSSYSSGWGSRSISGGNEPGSSRSRSTRYRDPYDDDDY